ncbi:MAG: nucleoside-diphosphate sugar epimerase/dehydratase [Cocleimonas sp.]
MISYILNAPRTTKRLISIAYDFLAIPLSIYLALALRLDTLIPDISPELASSMAVTTVASIIIFIRIGLYRAVVRFMAEKAFASLLIGSGLSALTFATSSFLLQAEIPRSTIIIYLFSLLIFIGTPRLFIRAIVIQLSKSGTEPVLIYGAGHQGIALANSLMNSDTYRPCAFIDDNKKKQKTVIHGLKVFPASMLDELLEGGSRKKVLLALGSASSSTRKRLLEQLACKKIEVLTTPSVNDIVSGKAKIEEVKKVEIEDLLGRDPVSPLTELVQQCITDKVVAITGAGGSIGSEICRQVILQKPTKLILIELNEFSLYSIEQELNQLKEIQGLELDIISILGSVQKEHRLKTVFETFKVETVYHAAAYKHVPMVEHNVVEGVRNNIFGTWYCAEAAIKAQVKNFVLISTDKAVRPTNVMGTSKRVAELVLQALAKRQEDTRFTMVRFGNVLGSSGSVVPLFHRQIQQGGPITVTHPDIIRYFMTIPEAAQLVIQAGSMGKGGDVFVLDMGEPVKITALARKMIHLSGLSEKHEQNPNGDIAIEYSGLRPGEKLYEELLVGDNVEGTEHPRIMTANEVHLSWPETHNLLNRLDKACHEFNVDDVIDLLLEAPAAFNKQGDCPDWVRNA